MDRYEETMYLFERIALAVQAAIEDAAEYGDDPADRIIKTQAGVEIITRRSRDVSQSHNGGDYTFWTRFEEVQESEEPTGVIEADDWSADFDCQSQPYLHQVNYTAGGLYEKAVEKAAGFGVTL